MIKLSGTMHNSQELKCSHQNNKPVRAENQQDADSVSQIKTSRK